jgi:hypothetical protein
MENYSSNNYDYFGKRTKIQFKSKQIKTKQNKNRLESGILPRRRQKRKNERTKERKTMARHLLLFFLVLRWVNVIGGKIIEQKNLRKQATTKRGRIGGDAKTPSDPAFKHPPSGTGKVEERRGE